MADTHFLIQKEEKNQNTITSLYPLQEKESLEELARLLASDDITDTVLSNAFELRQSAKQHKNLK